MKLTVTNTSPLPLYRQMYDQLAAQILRGEIAPGEVLPPIRTVAQELSVSLISVRRAWEELERDGFIHTAVGRGTFAAALGETDKAAMRRAILKEKLTDAAQFCAAGKERFALVSFAYTLTDPMGLHMRPAGMMAKRLAETPCSVVIRCGTRSADAKSILNVMALAAKCGETVTIEVSGEDEEATLQELREFFTANF